MPWNLFPTKHTTISKTTLDLLFLLGLMVLFYGNPFLNPRVTSYGGDGLSLFLPALDLYRNSVFNGNIPLWNPFTWNGAPFLAPYQSAVLYPPQLISLVFSHSATALNFGIFLSILWLAFGCYIFGVRALQLERFPSLLMAIAVSCSGFVGAHTDHVNQLAAISWVPWILSEAMILLRFSKLKSVALLAFFVGMQILAGHPQYVTYTFGYLIALAVCYFVYFYHRRKADEPPAWLGLALLLVAVFIGYGLGAAQLLPSYELSQMSVRQIDPPERMFAFSYPPRHLVSMFYGNAFGNPVTGLQDLFARGREYSYNFSEFTSYIGILTMGLAILGTLTLFQEFPVRAFFLLALLSVIGAFGEYVWRGIPYQTIMMMLPGGDHLRAPARFLFFFALSLSVLAAVGFNQVFFYLRERRRIRSSTLAPLRIFVLVLVLFDLYLFSTNQVFRYPGATILFQNKGAVWKFFEDNPGDYRVFRQMVEVPYNTDQNRLAVYGREKEIYTGLQYRRLQTNLNMLGHMETSHGYEEGLLPTLSFLNSIGQDLGTNLMGVYSRNVNNPKPDTIFMGLMNVKYILSDKPLFGERLRPVLASVDYDAARSLAQDRIGRAERRIRALQDRADTRDIQQVIENLNNYIGALRQQSAMLNFENADLMYRSIIYENLDYIPKFTWGKPLRELYDIDAMNVPLERAQNLLPRTDEAGDPRYENINLNYRRAPAGTTSTLTHANLTNQAILYNRRIGSPNGYNLTKPRDSEGEVVMLEASYPGWVCKLGNTKRPMRIVNAMMMSCLVPSGVEEFQVRYEPFSFRLGLFISCLFVLLVCAIAVFYRYPHMRPPSPPPPPLRERPFHTEGC